MSIREDATWDTLNEQAMHPFSEREVIESLDRLRGLLNAWHGIRESGIEDGREMVACGGDLKTALGEAVLAFQATFQRRRKEFAAERRALAKPSKFRE